MRPLFVSVLATLAVVIWVTEFVWAGPINPTEPVAHRHPVMKRYHGIPLVDDYAWLKAANWQQALEEPSLLPVEIKAYLNAENKYFYANMQSSRALQESLYKELIGRVDQDDSTVPAIDNDYAYFTRDIPGKDYPILLRRPVFLFKGLNKPEQQRALFLLNPLAEDEVLLDGNRLAQGKPGFNLGKASHSPDHQLLAYSVDYNGSENYQILVRDLRTGKDRHDHLLNTDGNMQWLIDSSGFFYVRKDKHNRARMVWRHTLGTPQDQDKRVYQTAPDSGLNVSVWITRNHHFYGISVSNFHSGEIYLIDVTKPDSTPRLLAKREADLEYSICQYQDRLFIRTNADGADDFKIVSTPLNTPQRQYWRDLVPHKAGRMIVSFELFAHHLVWLQRENGVDSLHVRRLSDGQEHSVSFNQQAYTLKYSGGYEFNTNVIRLYVSSLTTPEKVYDYHMDSHQMVLRKQQRIPSGHRTGDYITRRILATAHDGEKIPVTLLYHKKTPLDGTAPAFMYGYGAYGRSVNSHFRKNFLSLAKRGFVIALAHVRGGMEKGYAWYKKGRLRYKKNTFDDFISAARYLVKKKYARGGRIIAYGASAGGMIMGAIANTSDRLFCGIVTDVPFVDVLNTMLDESLPLTPSEWPEWGNPITNVKDFRYIRSYSPYDNVRTKNYPHMMVLASVSDSRVTYWEPAKWVAKIRAMRTNDNLLVLRTDMHSGHAGARGRFAGLQGVALIYAFAIKAVNGSRCMTNRPE